MALPETIVALLVLNAGSSSLKFRLFAPDSLDELAGGTIEDLDIDGHAGAFAALRTQLQRDAAETPVTAIAHRVVHGGDRYAGPVVIDAAVEAAIAALSPLAPLHNPASLAVIRVARDAFPAAPQLAVFDTAFHQTLPDHAWRYAVAEEISRRGVRRHGFHGISHADVARRAAEFLGRDNLKLVSLHLGQGASAAAIDSGRCIDTSMGLTPLEGLVMGTRSGDLDPALIFHLVREHAMPLPKVEALLTRESGLKGLCGSGDMREILGRLAAGDDSARLALDLYCYRIRKYIGAYSAALGGIDALAFTAGVGENAPEVRARACAGLAHLGVRIDPDRNRLARGDISPIHAGDSTVAVLVIRANEEFEIARQVRELLDTAVSQGNEP